MIFDELPSYEFNMYYSDSFDRYCINNILVNRHLLKMTLEVKSIRKYKQNHNIKIFPVDIDIRQKLSKYQDEILFRIFFQHADYVTLDNEKETLIAQEGFNYLNSDSFFDFLQKKRAIEKSIIESEIEKSRLHKIYNLFHAEQCDNRENAMLENIYNYNKENQYNQAVFLIGAEHTKSILQKVTAYEKLSELKLNWIMYGKK